MLVIVWEAMNAVIPRLQAEEYMAQYTVAVMSTPASDRNAVWVRQKVIDEWMDLASPVRKARRAMEVSLVKFKELLHNAFPGQIRS
jgi:hypothetical protein